MKKITASLLICVLLFGALCGCGAGFVENDFDLPETKVSAPGALDVFGGTDIGFSFLYPYGMTVTWNDTDGACISNEAGKIPYVLVNKTEKRGMTPEDYFKASNKQMLKEFDSVQSTVIHQVPLDNKTLYMTRYQCTTNGVTLFVDRYVEIYKNCYIQYTAITNEAEEMNTALYYAASTLSPEAGYYYGEYSKKLISYEQEETGISIQLPEMLTTKELTIGYFASCNDAIMLAVVCNQDDNGNPIYNRQNFMDRAAENPNFVAGYLGADSTTFESGNVKTINEMEFYAYPMHMQTGEEEFIGEIYLANARETGCIVLCYAVKNNGARLETLSELCLKAINTFEY